MTGFMNDLQIAKREILKAQRRKAAKRHYDLYKTAILEKQRKSRRGRVKPIATTFGPMYSQEFLAWKLRRSPSTINRWIVEGILPTGRYMRKGQHLYPREEIEAILSAFALINNSLSGPGGKYKMVEIRGLRVPFRQYVHNQILQLRRNNA